MKLFYILCGFICIGLGIIGIVVPGLPTTPFLLLALFCFTKGSEKMRLWFVQTKLYKKYLQEFDEKKAMTMKQKITILAIAFPFTLLAFWSLPHIGGKIVLAVLVAVQYWYFFCKMKTLEAEPLKS